MGKKYENVEVVLNTKGVGALLKGPEMKSLLDELGAHFAVQCGQGYSHDVKNMGTRAIGSYFAETYEAMQDNADNNTLLRVLP